MSTKLLAEWFWVDRWMGSSAFSLPIDARGLYREMLSQAWRRQARLPNDHDQIRRLTAVTEKEWRRTWPLVERFWRVDGDSLVNDTQLDVYADASARSSRAQARAQAGAQARHKQRSSSAQALASVSDLRSPIQRIDPGSLKDLQVVPDETIDEETRRLERNRSAKPFR